MTAATATAASVAGRGPSVSSHGRGLCGKQPRQKLAARAAAIRSDCTEPKGETRIGATSLIYPSPSSRKINMTCRSADGMYVPHCHAKWCPSTVNNETPGPNLLHCRKPDTATAPKAIRRGRPRRIKIETKPTGSPRPQLALRSPPTQLSKIEAPAACFQLGTF